MCFLRILKRARAAKTANNAVSAPPMLYSGVTKGGEGASVGVGVGVGKESIIETLVEG